jgi:hypothetical protein
MLIAAPEAEEESEQYYNADRTPMDPDSDNDSTFSPTLGEETAKGDAEELWKDFDWSIEESIERTSGEASPDPVLPRNSDSPEEQVTNEVSDDSPSVKEQRLCGCLGPLKNKVQEAFAQVTGRRVGLVPKM